MNDDDWSDWPTIFVIIMAVVAYTVLCGAVQYNDPGYFFSLK